MSVKKFENKHLDEVMNLWLQVNLNAHGFISPEYWNSAFNRVKKKLPTAELYIYQTTTDIEGFIGLIKRRYVAGLFVAEKCRKRGIGHNLLEWAQTLCPHLELDVYAANQQAVKFYEANGFSISYEKTDQSTGHLEYRMAWLNPQKQLNKLQIENSWPADQTDKNQ